MSRGKSRSGWEIFRWPLLIAAVSLIGLLSALLGDGWADVLSWLALGGVLAILVVEYCRG
jgi:hypothetical protein